MNHRDSESQRRIHMKLQHETKEKVASQEPNASQAAGAPLPEQHEAMIPFRGQVVITRIRGHLMTGAEFARREAKKTMH